MRISITLRWLSATGGTDQATNCDSLAEMDRVVRDRRRAQLECTRLPHEDLEPIGHTCGIRRADELRPARRPEGLDDVSCSAPDRVAICADCGDVGACGELGQLILEPGPAGILFTLSHTQAPETRHIVEAPTFEVNGQARGGFIYHGASIPTLRGTYVFGDQTLSIRLPGWYGRSYWTGGHVVSP